MSRIVLIHGFATGIGYSVFRSAHGVDAGFSAFRSIVDSGEAKAFRWDIKEHASFIQSLNPFYTWDVYRREKKIAHNPKTYQDLAEFLSREQPETIICHSMGCFLLLQYLKYEKLPMSVRHIVFNQADVSHSKTTFPVDIESRVGEKNLLITNTYCPWDPTLWFSAIMSGSLKAGLIGLKNPLVQNRLFPLWKPINLHTAGIRGQDFHDLILRANVSRI